MADPLKILIVDDSRVFRAAVEEALSGQSDIRVVGSVWTGEKAIDFVRQWPPDLVTLDVEMPGMGGLETLREIQDWNEERPEAPPIGVLLVSSFTRHGAAVTVEGLEAGAFDFLTKPAGPNEAENRELLKQQLLGKIRLFATSRQRRGMPRSPRPVAAAPPLSRPRETAAPPGYRAIVVAASTGGPEALARLLPELTSACDLPILIVQHLPPQFTEFLARHLSRKCLVPVVEATEGQPVESAVVYLAPGGKHLLVRSQANRIVTTLTEQPAENGCRPAADVLFRAAATVWGPRVIAIVLSGMGSDGTAGLAVLKRAGGTAIVQDEETSVVWGMPGSAVAAGLADQVLPLSKIADAVAELCREQ